MVDWLHIEGTTKALYKHNTFYIFITTDSLMTFTRFYENWTNDCYTNCYTLSCSCFFKLEIIDSRNGVWLSAWNEKRTFFCILHDSQEIMQNSKLAEMFVLAAFKESEGKKDFFILANMVYAKISIEVSVGS